MTYELHHGDCVEVMRSLPAESVDAIVTSPPYAEQRKATYGGIPETDYPAWTVAWMLEARRLLKPDGSVIINITPHIKGGVLSDYVLRTRLELREDGWAELGELVWSKPNSMPTGAPHRPRRSWESLLWYGKHGRAWSDAKSAGQPHKRGDSNGFLTATGEKVSNAAKRNSWGHAGGNGSTPPSGNARTRDIIEMSASGSGRNVNHPAPFPVPLAEWCGKLICPPGGVLLDPFAGSASSGVAAIRNGWDYIGIDAVQEYIDMSEQRLTNVTENMRQGDAS